MSQQFIPLSVPNFSGNEKQYVNEAVISEWVSTGGSKVSEFEEKIAEYTHMPRAVACNSSRPWPWAEAPARRWAWRATASATSTSWARPATRGASRGVRKE